MPPEAADPPETLTATDGAFACPRCGAEVGERFYGPCTSCRTELRRALSGEARDVEPTAYEPAMHVTPNAVATKDD